MRPLEQAFKRLQRNGFVTDKGTTHTYIPFYEELLSSFREKDINLIEIGIGEGASILLWRDYFINPKRQIYGIDIQIDCCKKIETMLGINEKVCYGNATVWDTWALLPTPDIIIDDGSHNSKDIIDSFIIGTSLLNSGGIYVIEDIQNDEIIKDLSFKKIEVFDRRQLSGAQSDDRLVVYHKEDI